MALKPKIAPIEEVIRDISSINTDEELALVKAYNDYKNCVNLKAVPFTSKTLGGICYLTHIISKEVSYLEEHGSSSETYTLECYNYHLMQLINAFPI